MQICTQERFGDILTNNSNYLKRSTVQIEHEMESTQFLSRCRYCVMRLMATSITVTKCPFAQLGQKRNIPKS